MTSEMCRMTRTSTNPRSALAGALACCVSALAALPAQAGPGDGAGMIEMLMTGRDPGPARVALPTSGHGGLGEGSLGRIERIIDPRFDRQEVAYSGPHEPGTVIIDSPEKFLYLVLPGGRALRYGIGVGRPGFTWAGEKRVTRKAEWPSWTPPQEMLRRRPDLPRFMPGGPENPMGARALYLGSTLYRIHGTNEPETIGTNVSSGCIRLRNEDVIDLYGRVPVGAKVIVI
jgi:lipoprotein-anchoring transpeptidase ErfK/SrfK